MEQIAFLGSFDKKDLLLNMAKILETLRFRVLIIDATLMQRLRYIVPNVGKNNSITYVSEYQGIDIAVGFMNTMGILQYLNVSEIPYDFVLIDTDNVQTMNSFRIENVRKKFFVTSYDQYEISRMIETFQFFNKTMEIYKVIISADITEQQEQYLNRLLTDTPIVTNKNIQINFADSIEDRKTTLQNQLTKEIRLKFYTNLYKGSLEYLTAVATEGIVNQGDIRKTIKKL